MPRWASRCRVLGRSASPTAFHLTARRSGSRRIRVDISTAGIGKAHVCRRQRTGLRASRRALSRTRYQQGAHEATNTRAVGHCAPRPPNQTRINKYSLPFPRVRFGWIPPHPQCGAIVPENADLSGLMLARLNAETLPCATSSGTTLGAAPSEPRIQGGLVLRPIRSGRPQRATGVARLQALTHAPALARWRLRSRLTLRRKPPGFAGERFTMNLPNSYVP